MVKRIAHFFDRLEDKVRARLSHYPIVYAFLGGVGIVLFWRGIWRIADDYSVSGSASTLLGLVILLMTGVFVSAFIGNRLLLTGLRGEKKLADLTEEEIKGEDTRFDAIDAELGRVEKELKDIEKEIGHRS